MKKIAFLIIFVLLAVNCAALSDDLLYSVEEIDTEMTIGSKFRISKTSNDYNVVRVVANLSFIPLEKEGQHIVDMDFYPQPETINGGALFKWENAGLGDFSFRVSTTLKNKIHFEKVKRKIKFPIKDLDEDFLIYTNPTENINSDDKNVIKKASEIVAGEDDLYVVVFKLVKWIKENVEYDLNTLTEKASQKASWVLENKYGVCDEITSLFVAMARSLGIPAKYVSGMAYTNLEGLNDWGPHAWAEVYFPGYGWVSFDISYSEFGYVDATHITIKESLDSSESSTHYEWRGRNIDIETNDLEIGVGLTGKRGFHRGFVELEAGVLREKVGFGSYNLIEAEIENTADFYVCEDLKLAKVEEVEIIGENNKIILLKPGERKKVYWIIKVDDDLEESYIYTFPINVYTVRNVSSQSKFTSSVKNKVYSKGEMDYLLEQISEEEEKVYSRELTLDCDSYGEVYAGEELEIICSVVNGGNVFLEGLNVCLEKDCGSIDLGITQEEVVSFLVKTSDIGEQEAVITAKSKGVSKADYVKYAVLDKPVIEISELEYPEIMKFGEESSISFLLDKKSYSNPKNIEVFLYQNNVPEKWEIEELDNTEDFIIKMNSDSFGSGENKFRLEILYEDGRGREYSVTKSFVIRVEADRFRDKIMLFLNKMEYFLRGLFSKLFG